MGKIEYKPILPKTINRAAAFILDAILLLVLFTGILYFISLIADFDTHYAILQEEYKKVCYLVFNPEINDYQAISPTDPNFDYVVELINDNEVLLKELSFVNTFSVNAPLIGLAISLFILEFIVPLILKNGQTVGMKFFKIALISNNNLAITTTQLFARCIIGKIAVLGIIPMLAILYIFLNAGGGLFGTIILLVVVIIQIVMLIKNKNHEGIADKIANVHPVNFTETVIYKTQKELDEAYYNYNK